MNQQNDKAIGASKFLPDDLDRRIIAHFRIDGRAPMSTVAAALGVSRATVQTRLERLLATGTLMGFTARVRDDYDVRTVRAMMMIEVRGKSTTHVIRRFRCISEIHLLHTTNGSWDLVAEIRTESLDDFDRVLRQVRMIEGVDKSETSLLLSSV